MRYTNTKPALVLGLLLVTLGVGLTAAAAGYSSGDGSDLANNSTVIEDIEPGDNITVEAAFSAAESVSAEIRYNRSQTLQFNDSGSINNLSVVSGGVFKSVTLSANSSEISNASGDVVDNATVTVDWPTVNGSLESPNQLDFQVAFTGQYNASKINKTQLTYPDNSGFFGSVGGDSSSQTFLILVVLAGAGYWAVRRDII